MVERETPRSTTTRARIMTARYCAKHASPDCRPPRRSEFALKSRASVKPRVFSSGGLASYKTSQVYRIVAWDRSPPSQDVTWTKSCAPACEHPTTACCPSPLSETARALSSRRWRMSALEVVAACAAARGDVNRPDCLAIERHAGQPGQNDWTPAASERRTSS